MFISNNRASFHLWGKENLVKHRKVSKYYETDCRLGLELKNLKVFASDGASVMMDVNNCVAVRLRENQDLTHILDTHCICYRLALAC